MVDMRVSHQTTEKYHVEIDDQALRQFLQLEGYNVPREAKMIVRVPGGGDWSNMDLDIDSRYPIEVSWSQTQEEDNG